MCVVTQKKIPVRWRSGREGAVGRGDRSPSLAREVFFVRRADGAVATSDPETDVSVCCVVARTG